ncbi:MAG: PBP1A family penicillin-binding protein, partial [Armatimonadetes bacterium]|nr:PBP1A family penicillin-binding protein [Armatimonadota bacterium]
MQQVRRPRRRFSILRWVLFAALTIDGLAVGLAAGVYATVAPLVPDEGSLSGYQPKETTRIFSADGALLATLFDENRKVVPIAELPRWLVQATIAIEDERFREHPGVDLRGIARAVYENLGGARQGASTITQQLARDIYLTRDVTLSRKLQEMTLALRIERRYSKEEILGLYMNQICYGHRAYGVNAAAETLFGKKLEKLTLGECALIAGLAKNPQGYSPIDHSDRARSRRNIVLNKMLELGYITQAEYDAARAEPIRTQGRPPERWKLKNYRAPWFTTYVVQQLIERYGEEKVRHGGLQVYTTIDLALQERAQTEMAQAIERLSDQGANRGAIVCLDPNTGRILAMVGGIDFAHDEFNGACQAHRQPGSSFKPFVYTTAMERYGLQPDDCESGTPETFNGYWGTYTPQNYSPNQGGSMTIAHALAISCNVVAVRTIIRTGPRHVIEMAHALGIDPQNKYLQPYPSLALGSSEVTPLEMATAYSAFANGGFAVAPACIDEVHDSQGTVIYSAVPLLRKAFSGQTYYNINSMLQGVISGGTGRPAAIDSPCGGKTGTTNSAKDVWFIGFTPGISCAVWVGNDRNRRMYDASGSGFCAPIWRSVVLAARELAEKRGRPWPGQFAKPGDDGPIIAAPAVVQVTGETIQTTPPPPKPTAAKPAAAAKPTDLPSLAGEPSATDGPGVDTDLPHPDLAPEPHSPPVDTPA